MLLRVAYASRHSKIVVFASTHFPISFEMRFRPSPMKCNSSMATPLLTLRLEVRVGIEKNLLGEGTGKA